MTHNTRELEEKYWNSKPKKKVTGEGVVVSLSKNEFNELLSNFHHQLQKAREENADKLYGEGYYNGIMYERERIEAIFKEHVPFHAMDLEDSVWLKRLLNKAFNHNQNV